MTTQIATFSWLNDNATNTKATIDAVNTLITGVGLQRTTDTGQLDTSTITGTTTTTGLSFGYHVYKFPDALQSTTPIIMKVGYKNDGNTGKIFAEITVGSATNGAGTVSSPTLLSTQTGSGPYQASLNSYACYVDGTFSMVLGYSALANVTVFNTTGAVVIDRARNASGTAQSAGFLVEAPSLNFNSSPVSRSFYGPASPNTSGGFIPALVPSQTATSTAEGANVNVFRHYMMVPGVRPSLGSLSYIYSEFGALTPFTATVLGSSHTYLPMGYGLTNWHANPGATPVVCGAIRWE